MSLVDEVEDLRAERDRLREQVERYEEAHKLMDWLLLPRNPKARAERVAQIVAERNGYEKALRWYSNDVRIGYKARAALAGSAPPPEEQK